MLLNKVMHYGIVNRLCPWCTGELEIPHGNLPGLERVRMERRRVYETVVRRQMVECERRMKGAEEVRLG
jgi:hypothetical protein